MNLLEFARRMPKVELHVHLEGAIRPATLLALARRNKVALPAADEAGLREWYRFRDFRHFVEVYVAITGCMRTPDDYRLVAYEFGHDCARQNIRYAEVTFTILTNMRLTGLSWQEILNGLNAGRAQARQELGVDWRWVFDIVRENTDTQQAVLEIALQARDQGVVALGLGGMEAGHPAEQFAEAFGLARAGGLARAPHAGELSGPESVWAAIRVLHADRIGHGVRSIEDPQLIAYLRQQQIPLEICPTSNIRLGVYPDYAAHPLRRLWDAGVLVTVNSDDPPLFDADLNAEYAALVEHFGFTAGELERISLNAVAASLLPEAEKARLAGEVRAEFGRLRENQGENNPTAA